MHETKTKSAKKVIFGFPGDPGMTDKELATAFTGGEDLVHVKSFTY